jgi:hypothetical protein
MTPIPMREVPPPIKYILLAASAFVPICVIGIVAFEVPITILLKTFSVGAVINPEALIVVVDIPSFADTLPDIFARPTTSRDTDGDELPMPMRALPPPTKYKLFAVFAFVPIWTSGAVDTALVATMVPSEFIDDAVTPLFAVISPEAVMVVEDKPPCVCIKPVVCIVPLEIVVAEIPASAFIIPSDVIVEAFKPALADINPKDVMVESDIIPPTVFITPSEFIAFAVIPFVAVIIPDADIVVAMIPPSAVMRLPEGTVMPALAVMIPPAVIVVVVERLFADIVVATERLFADIPATTPIVFALIAPDILAFPRTSREAVGAELPIPILALPPPTKYILLLADTLLPNWTTGVISVAVFASIVPDVSMLVADIPPFAVKTFVAGMVSPLLALIKPDAVIVVAEIPPFAVNKLPGKTVRPPVAFISSLAFKKDVYVPPSASNALP